MKRKNIEHCTADTYNNKPRCKLKVNSEHILKTERTLKTYIDKNNNQNDPSDNSIYISKQESRRSKRKKKPPDLLKISKH